MTTAFMAVGYILCSDGNDWEKYCLLRCDIP